MVSAEPLDRLDLHLKAAIVYDHRVHYGWFKPSQCKSCGELVELKHVSRNYWDRWSMR